MKKLEIYEPAMCCSTGVCGVEVDPVLVQFAADFQWLSEQGVEVARYNLSQVPQAFAANPVVKASLEKEGNECLPLILVDGQIGSKGRYPAREELACLSGVGMGTPAPSIYTDAVAELVAIGAAISANCEPCFKYHFQQAKKLGVSREDMMRAVKTAQSVKETPAKAMLQLAHRFLEGDPVELPVVQSCRG
ncbi:arsenite efflux transporter metallochaperone ArsD [Methylocaldum sp.]|uniref:arsenite efflux transporter metallochaperone ArsD n=1 Tax=Methylocaldum sp. TaxID=1969727 RepID=UPI002D64B8E0|nr:arsenite efflux transporter metallochaperone ArsD [Methylocaldum sp.]HYE34042.1 arsenite efflux transporter metallochaperone ArsD [Methylocaldum sp.]